MAFQDGLRALDPDIVTLQETVLTAEVDQAAEMLGDGYHLAQQQEREAGRAGVPAGQGITTASKWPFGRVFEIDFHVTGRTSDFACTCLVTEVLAPPPWGRVWVANHFPDYQFDHERERHLQAVAAARTLESLVEGSPGHVIVAEDMDADPAPSSTKEPPHPATTTGSPSNSARQDCRPDGRAPSVRLAGKYVSTYCWSYGRA